MKDKKLSLRELRCTTGAFETVFLSLFHSRVTGQEAGLLEFRTKVRIIDEKGAGNAVADGAGLAGETAALDASDNVDLLGSAGELEGLTDDDLQGLKTEVVVNVSVVDGDLAGAGIKADTGNGRFSTAGAVIIVAFVHSYVPSLKLANFRLLSLMLVLSVVVDVQSGELLSAESVVRKHALDGLLHGNLGVLLHEGAVLDFLHVTNVTGETIVDLLVQLLAGENGLGSVYDDDEVSRVNIRHKVRFMFSAKDSSGFGCDLTEGFALSVKHIPFALYFAGFWHISRHTSSSIEFLIARLSYHSAHSVSTKISIFFNLEVEFSRFLSFSLFFGRFTR